MLSPLGGLPVLWWRLLTEKQDTKGKWQQESLEQSQASFLLDDGSGSCLVDPESAAMLVQRREVTQQDDRRYTLWTLLPQDRVYVLGDFRTLGCLADGALNESQRLSELLEQWKADQAGLLAHHLSRALGVPVQHEGLLRRRHTERLMQSLLDEGIDPRATVRLDAPTTLSLIDRKSVV